MIKDVKEIKEMDDEMFAQLKKAIDEESARRNIGSREAALKVALQVIAKANEIRQRIEKADTALEVEILRRMLLSALDEMQTSQGAEKGQEEKEEEFKEVFADILFRTVMRLDKQQSEKQQGEEQ